MVIDLILHLACIFLKDLPCLSLLEPSQENMIQLARLWGDGNYSPGFVSLLLLRFLRFLGKRANLPFLKHFTKCQRMQLWSYSIFDGSLSSARSTAQAIQNNPQSLLPTFSLYLRILSLIHCQLKNSCKKTHKFFASCVCGALSVLSYTTTVSGKFDYNNQWFTSS